MDELLQSLQEASTPKSRLDAAEAWNVRPLSARGPRERGRSWARSNSLSRRRPRRGCGWLPTRLPWRARSHRGCCGTRTGRRASTVGHCLPCIRPAALLSCWPPALA